MSKSEMPGREIPKEYREVVEHLVRQQGWRYRTGGRHSMLFPADPEQRPMAVPGTPGDNRAFRNWLSDVRRRGGKWPPERKG